MEKTRPEVIPNIKAYNALLSNERTLTSVAVKSIPQIKRNFLLNIIYSPLANNYLPSLNLHVLF
jgi:hypothetical protein